ncbi:MAG: 30S ribosomal protein S3 [Patescibacteria group bacterium]
MAQKINPTSFRLGVTIPWSSRWFFKKKFNFFIEEDLLIRKLIKEKILVAGIAAIEIERTNKIIRVSIKAARPGLIIGRGGKGIEDLKNFLLKNLKKLRKQNNQPQDFSLNLSIEELKRSEVSAAVLSQQIAFDIEKRLPYRKIIRRSLENLKQNRGVFGAKIKLSGRLNGAEIARQDSLGFGRMPLQTLRANIDYGEATAFNTYGTVGIKVWIYKGEIFFETPRK